MSGPAPEAQKGKQPVEGKKGKRQQKNQKHQAQHDAAPKEQPQH